jgi:hypothetical protein
MAVRWSRRASLECLRTKAELKANAIRRIKVTAASPRLETSSRSPQAAACFGAVPASVEKSVFESPMFRQIHPTVVLILPAAVPQLADNRSGKYLLGQRGDPKPFVVGGVRSQFSFAVTIAIEHLFGAHYPHRFGVVDREGQTFGIPELNSVCLMVALLGKT